MVISRVTPETKPSSNASVAAVVSRKFHRDVKYSRVTQLTNITIRTTKLKELIFSLNTKIRSSPACYKKNINTNQKKNHFMEKDGFPNA